MTTSPIQAAIDQGVSPALQGFPRAVTVAAAVGAGTMAGVFFAFSTFVMPALRKVPAEPGLRAMQSINREAPASPLFMAALFGTAVVTVVLGVYGVLHRDQPFARYLLAGAALYLVCIVITGIYHVPHNDALGLLDPTRSASHVTWRGYLGGWAAWNHVRTLAPLAGSVAFVLALGQR